MRKLAIVFAVLAIATVALAQNLVGVTYWPTAQSAPSGNCQSSTLGLDISNVSGWQVTGVTDAGTGGTYGDWFRGDGTLECYYCAPAGYPVTTGGVAKVKRWARCNSAFDVIVDGGATVALAGQFTSSVGSGRVYYWPRAVFVVQSDAGVHDGGFYVTIEGKKGFAK